MINLIVFCAQYLYLMAPLIALGYFFVAPRRERKHIVILALVSFPLAYVALKLAAMLYFDPRPFVVSHVQPLISHEPDNGFPSDHALLLSSFAALFLFFNRKVSIVLWIIAITVSTARVSAGLHHPIDVIASMVIAIVVTSLAYFGLKQLKLFDLVRA